VAGFVARYRRRNFFLPRWRISHFDEQGVRLNSDILDLRPFTRRDGEVLLARDVLDKQLIDAAGKRVVRVNDVQIIEAAGEWRVTGADVSLAGLWRRLSPAFMRRGRPVEVIDWADVGYLATDAATVQLKSSRGKLARLHPVEIARLAEAFSYQQGPKSSNHSTMRQPRKHSRKWPPPARHRFSVIWTKNALQTFLSTCRRTKPPTSLVISLKIKRRTCLIGWRTTSSPKLQSCCLTKMTRRAG
jgi:hypothetical protein